MALSSFSRHPARLDPRMVTEAVRHFRASGGTFVICCAPQEHNQVLRNNINILKNRPGCMCITRSENTRAGWTSPSKTEFRLVCLQAGGSP
jgi:hypothetical protein